MDETRNSKAIILNNRAFRERDSLVDVYTEDFGRLSLVVRGTKTAKSKMRGHIDPLTLVRVMIIKGKRWDYLGSVVTENAFLKIRQDYEKISLASRVLRLYYDQVKPNEKEEGLFILLLDFLRFINDNEIAELEIFYSYFLLKFSSLYGLGPELKIHSGGKKGSVSERYFFNYQEACLSTGKQAAYCIPISVDAIKVMRLVLSEDFLKIKKLKYEKNVSFEIENVVKNFFAFHFKY